SRIAFEDGGQRIEADKVALDWSPLALLSGRVAVTRLEIGTLRVALQGQGGAPAQLPANLGLPLELSLAQARLDQLVLRAGGRSETLRAIELSARLGRSGHRLELRRAQTPWGALTAQASLGARAPYRLAAKATLARSDAPGPYQVSAQASGTLREIDLSADAERGALRARVRARVAPFKAQGGYAGSIAIENARAGSVDDGKIPAKALSLQFAGDPDDLALSRVRIDFGAAGALEGDGALRADNLELSLATSGFDLHRIDRSLRATHLQGELQLELQLAARQLLLKRVQLQEGGARLELSGQLGLDAPRALRLEGSVGKIDLAKFGRYPQSDLNARFRLAGQLLPQPGGELRLELHDSTLGGEAFTGTGKATLAPGRVRDAELQLRSGGNRLELRGAYGAPDDRIDLKLELPRLERILEGTAGSVMVDATLAGGLNGALSLDARLRGFRSGRLSLDQAKLSARGTLRRHALQLHAAGAGVELDAAADGGWQAGKGWAGRLTRLDARGALAAQLDAPAAVAIGGDGFSLEGLVLQASGARVRLDALSRRGDRIASRGAAEGVALELLRQVGALPAALRSTLKLSAEWDISGEPGSPATWSGRAELKRESGDLTLQGDAPLALGIERLELSARVDDGRVTASAEARGERLGMLQARAALGLVSDDLRASSLEATLEARMASIAWMAALVPRPIALDGGLRAAVTARGTLGAPRLSGSLSGDGLALRDVEQGVDLADGSLRAELRESKLVLNAFSLRAGGGRFEASGTLDLAGDAPELALDWKAAKLEAIRRPDRLLVLSGAGSIGLRAGRLRLSGRLAADQGLIILPEREGVTLSDDVVVKGRAAEREPARPLLAQLDLELDLGQRFVLKGRGLDARLTGSVRLRADEDRLPTGSGSIRVAEGTYSAYGQRLTIERGIISFSGPLDNPGLDIVALRKNQAVEAGVAVTGTASAPKVSLVSRPEVPDGDKLSWLVLGHGLDSANKSELDVMSAAAAALLAQGESASLQGKISAATGIDEFGVRGGSGGLRDAVMTVGKRLSSKVYLVYERGLFATGNAVKLRYTLSQRWSLQTQTGGDNAIDVFYNLLFD
ncbi:MAG TPA: translocation/assembly module TamB domain-containing protein, partial [Burkholderiales bacterium]|nr:translocation/assembly module TamB domain-containing protein [Burkholderiales bacterium]